jgi:hypothetical protein
MERFSEPWSISGFIISVGAIGDRARKLEALTTLSFMVSDSMVKISRTRPPDE